jgi:hypothetical protein
MWLLIKRFLAVLYVFALVGGGTISFAAATSASKPCAHEHGDSAGTPHQHDHHGAGCLACCLGACVAIPDLPPRTSLSAVKFAVARASYWEATVSLSDRSIPPDLGPPRTIA